MYQVSTSRSLAMCAAWVWERRSHSACPESRDVRPKENEKSLMLDLRVACTLPFVCHVNLSFALTSLLVLHNVTSPRPSHPGVHAPALDSARPSSDRTYI
jgi:hypothetical protein